MKVRVLIAFNEGGDWRAFGSSWDGGGKKDDERLLDEAWEWAEGIGRMVWVEANVPGPEPIPTVIGEASEA